MPSLSMPRTLLLPVWPSGPSTTTAYRRWMSLGTSIATSTGAGGCRRWLQASTQNSTGRRRDTTDLCRCQLLSVWCLCLSDSATPSCWRGARCLERRMQTSHCTRLCGGEHRRRSSQLGAQSRLPSHLESSNSTLEGGCEWTRRTRLCPARLPTFWLSPRSRWTTGVWGRQWCQPKKRQRRAGSGWRCSNCMLRGNL